MIDSARKRKIGDQLESWIFLGIRTGARRSVDQYRSLLLTEGFEQALPHLKRAVDMPHRARVRIETAISAYNARFGSGAVAFLNECLALVGTVTLAEINAEITSMENFSDNLVVQSPAPYGDGSMDWPDIADAIEGAVENESNGWTFQLPGNYVDVWGE